MCSSDLRQIDPLTSLRQLINESRINLPPDLPAASAGLFGYLGYDMIRLVEHLPDVNPDPLGLPDAVMMRPSVVAVLDGVKGDVTVVAPAWVSSGLSARSAYAQAAERVMDAVRDLDRALPQTSRTLGEAEEDAPPISNFTHEGYKRAVEKAKDYIKAGDIFQVVPSQRWSQSFRQPPFSLYRSLRRTNPSPFMFYFNFGGFQVIGASPEILVRVFDREVTIRPIAGTRPRGATPEEDRAYEVDLMADAKELAEHLMLLDLGRNDVGRVAKIGSVHPTEEFIVERYSHVMHIVSNVVGELAEDQDALSALLAGLPAGTVSGAPKVRAMEIIDELEPEKRGVYGGGVGYFSSGGDMDICIALRTAVVKEAIPLLQQEKRLLEICRPGKDLSGSFRLGFITTAAVRLLPGFLLAASQDAPLASFEFETGLSATLQDKVMSGQLDAAVITDADGLPSKLSANLLRQEPFVFAAHKSLLKDGLAGLISKHPFLHFMPDTGIGKLIERAMLDYDRPNDARTIVMDNLEAIMECVVAGLGFTLLPLPDVERYRVADVHTLEAPDTLERRLVLVSLRDSILDRNSDKLQALLGQ